MCFILYVVNYKAYTSKHVPILCRKSDTSNDSALMFYCLWFSSFLDLHVVLKGNIFLMSLTVMRIGTYTHTLMIMTSLLGT